MAFHPAPLPLIFAEILNGLGVEGSCENEDDFLATLRRTRQSWRQCVLLFRMIDALSLDARMALATVIRKFGNDVDLESSVLPIVTGNIELLNLTQENDLGISPLNGAKTIELSGYTQSELMDVLPWNQSGKFNEVSSRELCRLVWEQTGGHPGFVSILVFQLQRSHGTSQFCDLANMKQAVDDAARRPQVHGDVFIQRTIYSLKRSPELLRAVLEIYRDEQSAHTVSVQRQLDLTGAVVEHNGRVILSGSIFKRALKEALRRMALSFARCFMCSVYEVRLAVRLLVFA